VDLGEYLAIAQMRDLLSSIGQIYAPGARMIALTDGLLNVGVRTPAGTEPELVRYVDGLRSIRDQMSMRDRIAFLDLVELLDKDPRFPTVRDHIAERLIALRNHPDISQRMDSLARAMSPYIELAGRSTDTIRQVLETPYEQWRPDVRERCEWAARTYASNTIAMSILGTTTTAFPSAVRCTIVPKPAPQVPFVLVNDRSKVMPYNGVPVVSKRRYEATGSLAASTSILRRGQLLTVPDDVEGVCCKSGGQPTYYLQHNTA
jgi:hypothetical protein